MNTLGISDFTVRGYECASDARASFATICNYLQEAAGLQAMKSGFAKQNFNAAGENISWVLTRMCVRMNRYPNWEDRVTVETWPCGGRKIIANRDYTIRLGDEILGVATSEWMLIDLGTRKIVPIPQQVYEAANDERPRALPDFAFARLRWDCRTPSEALRLTALKDDIDVNGHVNNVRYIVWLTEALPKNCGPIAEFEIVFKSETLAGDEMFAESVEVSPGVFAAHVASAKDGRDHAVAQIKIKS